MVKDDFGNMMMLELIRVGFTQSVWGLIKIDHDIELITVFDKKQMKNKQRERYRTLTEWDEIDNKKNENKNGFKIQSVC